MSALPHGLGRWYVTRVRGFPRYDVGVLPVGGRVSRWLRDDGLRLVQTPADEAERWWRARAPAWGGAAGRGLSGRRGCGAKTRLAESVVPPAVGDSAPTGRMIPPAASPG